MNKAVFNRLMRFIHPYRRYLLVSLAFATGNVALTLYAPILVGRAIDLIIGQIGRASCRERVSLR